MRLYKKKTLAQVFSSEFCEISKNTFFTEHLWATTSVVYISLNKTYLLVNLKYSTLFLYCLHENIS